MPRPNFIRLLHADIHPLPHFDGLRGRFSHGLGLLLVQRRQERHVEVIPFVDGLGQESGAETVLLHAIGRFQAGAVQVEPFIHSVISLCACKCANLALFERVPGVTQVTVAP